MAKQLQKNQLIALISTDFNPTEVDEFRLGLFLEDPRRCHRFAEFINAYKPRIPMADLPDDNCIHSERGTESILGGVRPPREINFLDIMGFPYFHRRQIGEKYKNNRPSGHQILASLVASYKKVRRKKRSDTYHDYDITPTDRIHGHYGFPELDYMSKNWMTSVPAIFREWAKGKKLYGWRDVFRYDDGEDLRVPCLECGEDYPDMCFPNLDDLWADDAPGLCERVGAPTGVI